VNRELTSDLLCGWDLEAERRARVVMDYVVVVGCGVLAMRLQGSEVWTASVAIAVHVD